MRVLKVATLPLMLALAPAACESGRDGIRVDGSPGVLPLVEQLAIGFRESAPAIEVSLASGLGSSERVAAVADGRIDIAMASHGVDSAALAARGLRAHEIARTAVVFAVNEGVPVRALAADLVCEIFSGRAANWNRYNAGDIPIVPFMRPPDEVDAEVASAGVPCLQGLMPGGSVRMIQRPDSMAAALSSTRGAFGLTSMTMVQASDGRIVPLALDGVKPTPENLVAGRYPLLRRAWLITRDRPESPVREFLAFVTGARGQQIIRENGAVPVTTAQFLQ